MTSPDILARVSFLQGSQGGRTQPTPANYLGCICVIKGQNFDCRLLLANIGPIRPGETSVVPIKFLNTTMVRAYLTEGTHFLLKEASVIATGEITQIF
jgi:hypothetical protein